MSNTDKIRIDDKSWTNLRLGLSDIILKQAFINPKLNHKVEFPNIVFHYTTLEKFISILESQAFYFSSINYLNDSKEYLHGVDIILDIIKNYKSCESKTAILDSVEQNIQRIFDSLRYVACFSKNGDLLSQWRAYANQGKGLAIGFKSDNISDFDGGCISVKNIEYCEDIQKSMLDEIITICLNYFEQLKDLFDWTDYGYEYLVSTCIIEFLEEFISGYKHPTFSEEIEFRLEYCVDGNINKYKPEKVEFRATENLLIPYFKLDYTNKLDEADPKIPKHWKTKLPIEKIIIGPSLDFELNKSSIFNILLKYGYENIEIVQSKIPYRL